MALSTLSTLVLAPRQQYTFWKPITPQAAGSWHAAWLAPGIPVAPSAPAVGVNGAALTDATAGALCSFVNPASGLTYLAQFMAQGGFPAGENHTVYLYDRLWHNSGLSPTTAGAQAISPAALPARCPVKTDPTGRTFDANGLAVEAWFEVYTTMGAGSTAGTISYTDEAGNAGAVGTMQNFVTTAAVGRNFPFDLAAGDRGVRSVQSFTIGATMTSGTFGIVLRRRLATLWQPARNAVATLDWAQINAVIPDDACLEILVYASVAGSVNNIQGAILMAQG